MPLLFPSTRTSTTLLFFTTLIILLLAVLFTSTTAQGYDYLNETAYDMSNQCIEDNCTILQDFAVNIPFNHSYAIRLNNVYASDTLTVNIQPLDSSNTAPLSVILLDDEGYLDFLSRDTNNNITSHKLLHKDAIIGSHFPKHYFPYERPEDLTLGLKDYFLLNYDEVNIVLLNENDSFTNNMCPYSIGIQFHGFGCLYEIGFLSMFVLIIASLYITSRSTRACLDKWIFHWCWCCWWDDYNTKYQEAAHKSWRFRRQEYWLFSLSYHQAEQRLYYERTHQHPVYRKIDDGNDGNEGSGALGTKMSQKGFATFAKSSFMRGSRSFMLSNATSSNSNYYRGNTLTNGNGASMVGVTGSNVNLSRFKQDDPFAESSYHNTNYHHMGTELPQQRFNHNHAAEITGYYNQNGYNAGYFNGAVQNDNNNSNNINNNANDQGHLFDKIAGHDATTSLNLVGPSPPLLEQQSINQNNQQSSQQQQQKQQQTKPQFLSMPSLQHNHLNSPPQPIRPPTLAPPPSSSSSNNDPFLDPLPPPPTLPNNNDDNNVTYMSKLATVKRPIYNVKGNLLDEKNDTASPDGLRIITKPTRGLPPARADSTFDLRSPVEPFIQHQVVNDEIEFEEIEEDISLFTPLHIRTAMDRSLPINPDPYKHQSLPYIHQHATMNIPVSFIDPVYYTNTSVSTYAPMFLSSLEDFDLSSYHQLQFVLSLLYADAPLTLEEQYFYPHHTMSEYYYEDGVEGDAKMDQYVNQVDVHLDEFKHMQAGDYENTTAIDIETGLPSTHPQDFLLKQESQMYGHGIGGDSAGRHNNNRSNGHRRSIVTDGTDLSDLTTQNKTPQIQNRRQSTRPVDPQIAMLRGGGTPTMKGQHGSMLRNRQSLRDQQVSLATTGGQVISPLISNQSFFYNFNGNKDNNKLKRDNTLAKFEAKIHADFNHLLSNKTSNDYYEETTNINPDQQRQQLMLLAQRLNPQTWHLDEGAAMAIKGMQQTGNIVMKSGKIVEKTGKNFIHVVNPLNWGDMIQNRSLNLPESYFSPVTEGVEEEGVGNGDEGVNNNTIITPAITPPIQTSPHQLEPQPEPDQMVGRERLWTLEEEVDEDHESDDVTLTTTTTTPHNLLPHHHLKHHHSTTEVNESSQYEINYGDEAACDDVNMSNGDDFTTPSLYIHPRLLAHADKQEAQTTSHRRKIQRRGSVQNSQTPSVSSRSSQGQNDGQQLNNLSTDDQRLDNSTHDDENFHPNRPSTHSSKNPPFPAYGSRHNRSHSRPSRSSSREQNLDGMQRNMSYNHSSDQVVTAEAAILYEALPLNASLKDLKPMLMRRASSVARSSGNNNNGDDSDSYSTSIHTTPVPTPTHRRRAINNLIASDNVSVDTNNTGSINNNNNNKDNQSVSQFRKNRRTSQVSQRPTPTIGGATPQLPRTGPIVDSGMEDYIEVDVDRKYNGVAQPPQAQLAQLNNQRTEMSSGANDPMRIYKQQIKTHEKQQQYLFDDLSKNYLQYKTKRSLLLTTTTTTSSTTPTSSQTPRHLTMADVTSTTNPLNPVLQQNNIKPPGSQTPKQQQSHHYTFTPQSHPHNKLKGSQTPSLTPSQHERQRKVQQSGYGQTDMDETELMYGDLDPFALTPAIATQYHGAGDNNNQHYTTNFSQDETSSVISQSLPQPEEQYIDPFSMSINNQSNSIGGTNHPIIVTTTNNDDTGSYVSSSSRRQQNTQSTHQSTTHEGSVALSTTISQQSALLNTSINEMVQRLEDEEDEAVEIKQLLEYGFILGNTAVKNRLNENIKKYISRKITYDVDPPLPQPELDLDQMFMFQTEEEEKEYNDFMMSPKNDNITTTTQQPSPKPTTTDEKQPLVEEPEQEPREYLYIGDLTYLLDNIEQRLPNLKQTSYYYNDISRPPEDQVNLHYSYNYDSIPSRLDYLFHVTPPKLSGYGKLYEEVPWCLLCCNYKPYQRSRPPRVTRSHPFSWWNYDQIQTKLMTRQFNQRFAEHHNGNNGGNTQQEQAMLKTGDGVGVNGIKSTIPTNNKNSQTRNQRASSIASSTSSGTVDSTDEVDRLYANYAHDQNLRDGFEIYDQAMDADLITDENDITVTKEELYHHAIHHHFRHQRGCCFFGSRYKPPSQSSSAPDERQGEKLRQKIAQTRPENTHSGTTLGTDLNDLQSPRDSNNPYYEEESHFNQNELPSLETLHPQSSSNHQPTQQFNPNNFEGFTHEGYDDEENTAFSGISLKRKFGFNTILNHMRIPLPETTQDNSHSKLSSSDSTEELQGDQQFFLFTLHETVYERIISICAPYYLYMDNYSGGDLFDLPKIQEFDHGKQQHLGVDMGDDFYGRPCCYWPTGISFLASLSASSTLRYEELYVSWRDRIVKQINFDTKNAVKHYVSPTLDPVVNTTTTATVANTSQDTMNNQTQSPSSPIFATKSADITTTTTTTSSSSNNNINTNDTSNKPVTIDQFYVTLNSKIDVVVHDTINSKTNSPALYLTRAINVRQNAKGLYIMIPPPHVMDIYHMPSMEGDQHKYQHGWYYNSANNYYTIRDDETLPMYLRLHDMQQFQRLQELQMNPPPRLIASNNTTSAPHSTITPQEEVTKPTDEATTPSQATDATTSTEEATNNDETTESNKDTNGEEELETVSAKSKRSEDYKIPSKYDQLTFTDGDILKFDPRLYHINIITDYNSYFEDFVCTNYLPETLATIPADHPQAPKATISQLFPQPPQFISNTTSPQSSTVHNIPKPPLINSREDRSVMYPIVSIAPNVDPNFYTYKAMYQKRLMRLLNRYTFTFPHLRRSLTPNSHPIEVLRHLSAPVHTICLSKNEKIIPSGHNVHQSTLPLELIQNGSNPTGDNNSNTITSGNNNNNNNNNDEAQMNTNIAVLPSIFTYDTSKYLYPPAPVKSHWLTSMVYNLLPSFNWTRLPMTSHKIDCIETYCARPRVDWPHFWRSRIIYWYPFNPGYDEDLVAFRHRLVLVLAIVIFNLCLFISFSGSLEQMVNNLLSIVSSTPMVGSKMDWVTFWLTANFAQSFVIVMATPFVAWMFFDCERFKRSYDLKVRIAGWTMYLLFMIVGLALFFGAIFAFSLVLYTHRCTLIMEALFSFFFSSHLFSISCTWGIPLPILYVLMQLYGFVPRKEVLPPDQINQCQEPQQLRDKHNFDPCINTHDVQLGIDLHYIKRFYVQAGVSMADYDGELVYREAKN